MLFFLFNIQYKYLYLMYNINSNKASHNSKGLDIETRKYLIIIQRRAL